MIGTPRSRAMRVIWALEELGAAYRIEPALPRSAAARAGRPDGKVPALVTAEGTVGDSVAIVQFLADRHGRLTHPAGTFARACQDAATQFALDELDAPLWAAARHRFVLPEAERIREIIPLARADFARGLDGLALRLAEQPFLAGETFTVPDLVVGHCLDWAERAKFALPGDGPVADYLARLRARPALGRARARAAAALGD